MLHEKIKIYKALIELRYVKINPCEKTTTSQSAKSNPHEMFKKLLAKISLRQDFSS